MLNCLLRLVMTLSWMITAVLAGCTGASSEPDPVEGFSIYLVRQVGSGPQVREQDLTLLELEDEPFLSQDDIVAYSWETHTITLTDAARERLAALEVPLTTGRPFVVCVGDERIYPGAFWVSYSSMSFNGIVIDTLFAQMGNGSIPIQLGYPESPEFFVGEDLRSDPRIEQALSEAGKLR